MNIEKSPNKRKAPTLSTETENQDEIYEDAKYTTSNATKKIDTVSPLERRDLTRPKKKGTNNHEEQVYTKKIAQEKKNHKKKGKE